MKSDVVETKRVAPRVERDGENCVDVFSDNPDQVRDFYGMKTSEAANILLEIGLSAFGQKGLDYIELVPAMAVEMEPRDAVEAMLINQMAVTHYAMSSVAVKAVQASGYDVRESYERSITRLSRTFLALRRIGARTFTDVFKAIGAICDLYDPQECSNYFTASGYASG